MAEDPSEIREAIEATRSDMADTIEALGQKADVKARATDKVNETTEQIKAKASELCTRAEQAVPDEARPAVSAAIDQAKSVASTALSTARQRPALTAGVVVVLLVVLRHSRRAGR